MFVRRRDDEDQAARATPLERTMARIWLREPGSETKLLAMLVDLRDATLAPIQALSEEYDADECGRFGREPDDLTLCQCLACRLSRLLAPQDLG